ncbi:MAG: transporter associated domain-containing protein [Pseudomonadota bacterium]
MSETPDTPAVSGDDTKLSFVERLTQALSGGPETLTDLVDVLRDAQRRGVLDRDALDMIEGVFQVSEMKVRDIMIPRAQMDVVDRNDKPEKYLPIVTDSGHSRFPVIDGDKDKVAGILLAKDLLRYFQLDKKQRATFNLHDLLRPAVFVPESKRLNVLLREFRASRNHMAIVVDEYGGVAGLCTIEDVLEQIVGEIQDEYDIDDDDVLVVDRGNGEFVVKGLTPLAEFNSRLGLGLEHGDIETIGGYVMAKMGHVPDRGETLDVNGLRFEVLRADSRRVHLLKVFPVADVPAQPAS